MDLQGLNLIIALPELVLFLCIIFVLLTGLFINDKNLKITHFMSLASLSLVFALQIYVGLNFNRPEENYAFNRMFLNDSLAGYIKLLLYLITFFILVYGREYNKSHQLNKAEFYLLILFAVLGMNFMISANHFLILYIGLELLSLSLYTLIALKRTDSNAVEAAFKYFVLGSLASAIFLFGVSLIYGACGTLYVDQIFEIAKASMLQNHTFYLLIFASIFVTVGISFKLGTVPFHMWVPDVYQGSPLSVTNFLSAAPKIATVIFAYRILISSLAFQFDNWGVMIQIIAILSLFIGNFVAIMQGNIRKMLGYSTISHMGFVLLAFSANPYEAVVGSLGNSSTGINAAIYYIVTYALMSLAAFGVLIALSKEKECQNIHDLSGLNKKHPWFAFIMLLSIFSMAGIPPLMGFYAKFYIIIALVENHYNFLAVYAVLMALVGAFYYLRIVKIMYFDEPSEKWEHSLVFSKSAKILLSINGLLLIIFGVFPNIILAIIQNVVSFS